MTTVRQPGSDNRSYVLMTAAHNEERLIEGTIRSVVSQTLLPQRWVIVSDNSTDRTNEIVEYYAKQYDFLRFLRVTRPPGRSFGAKIAALNKAEALLAGASYEFIGNLDADVSIAPSYFEQLLNHFTQRPRLGLAAGFVYEENGSEFEIRSSNRVYSVPHAAQLLRRNCYEAIGGYPVLKYGGEDWYVQTSAKMMHWEVQAIPSLRIFHHRHTGTGTNLVKDRFRLGRLDHSVGSTPVFEIFKCLRRVPEHPFLVGAITRFLGFSWSYLSQEKRPVSEEFVAFLRREQRSKLRAFFSQGLRNRLLDSPSGENV